MHKLLCLVLLLGPSLCGQTELYLPASAQTVDGNSGGRLPGVADSFRLQALLGATHLTGTSSIRGIAFRRDGQFLKPLQGGRGSVRITMSDLAAVVTAAHPTFATNHGPTPTIVFDGWFDYPSAPQLQDRNAAGWSLQHVVSLSLPSPFAYRGGSLCIDLEGAESSNGFWPVDYFSDPLARGTAQSIGPGCGLHAGLARAGVAAQPHTLVIGCTTRIVTWGQPASPVACMLGHTQLGMSLEAFGAPGCFLHIAPAVTLTGWLSAPPRADLPGHLNLALQIPLERGLMAGSILFQAVNAELQPPFSNPGGLTTSQGLRLTFAANYPSLDAAVVESRHVLPFEATGSVDLTRAPVLRLTRN